MFIACHSAYFSQKTRGMDAVIFVWNLIHFPEWKTINAIIRTVVNIYVRLAIKEIMHVLRSISSDLLTIVMTKSVINAIVNPTSAIWAAVYVTMIYAKTVIDISLRLISAKVKKKYPS